MLVKKTGKNEEFCQKDEIWLELHVKMPLLWQWQMILRDSWHNKTSAWDKWAATEIFNITE